MRSLFLLILAVSIQMLEASSSSEFGLSENDGFGHTSSPAAQPPGTSQELPASLGISQLLTALATPQASQPKPPSTSQTHNHNAVPTQQNIDFVSSNSVQYPIKKIVFPNGEVVYGAYCQGVYRIMPESLELNYNGNTLQYFLSGNPPQIILTSPNGPSFPLKYAMENDEQVYYVCIDGNCMELPVQNGQPMPEMPETSQHNSTPQMPNAQQPGSPVPQQALPIPSIPSIPAVANIPHSLPAMPSIPVVQGGAPASGLPSIGTIPAVPSTQGAPVSGIPPITGFPTIPSIAPASGIPPVTGFPAVPSNAPAFGIPPIGAIPAVPSIQGAPVSGIPPIGGFPAAPSIAQPSGIPNIAPIPIMPSIQRAPVSEIPSITGFPAEPSIAPPAGEPNIAPILEIPSIQRAPVSGIPSITGFPAEPSIAPEYGIPPITTIPAVPSIKRAPLSGIPPITGFPATPPIAPAYEIPSITTIPGIPSIQRVPLSGIPPITGFPATPSIAPAYAIPSIGTIPAVPSIHRVPLPGISLYTGFPAEPTIAPESEIPPITTIPAVPSIKRAPISGIPPITGFPATPSVAPAHGISPITRIPGIPSIQGIPTSRIPPITGIPEMPPIPPPLGGFAPIPSMQPPAITFLNPASVQHPIKKVTLPNGEIVYGAYSQGSYKLLPASLNLNMNGQTISFELAGNPPVILLIGSNGQVCPIKYAIQNGHLVYYAVVNSQNIELPVSNQPLPTTSVQPQINFVSAYSLKHPPRSKTYPNGQTLYYAYAKGAYHELPESLQVNINGVTSTLTMGGTAPDIRLYGPNRVIYPIKYASENGQIQYYVTIDNQNMLLDFARGPLEPSNSEPLTHASQPIEPTTENLNFVNPNEVPNPIKKVTFPSGQTIYGAWSNGIYKELPASLQLSSSAGTINLTPSGTPPNVVMKASDGEYYPIKYTVQNKQQSYYIDLNGQLIKLPFGSGPPLPTPPVQPTINFISGDSLPYPVHRKVYPNGEVFYYGYSNGAYREFPYSVQVGRAGSINTFILTGIPPSLELTGPGNVILPIKYALNNSQIQYYVNLDGQNVQLQFGGGPVQPSSAEQPSGITEQSTPITFVSANSIPHPVRQRTFPNGQTYYFGYSNGAYRGLPYSVQMNENGAENTLTLGGTAPNIKLYGPNGVVYPIRFAIQNGQTQYYITIDGQNVKLNFGGGPIEPPLPPVQPTINFINPNAIPYPVKKVVFPNGQAIYGAYISGSYKELPSSLSFSSNGETINVTPTGTPPNLIFSGSDGQLYPLEYAMENGQQQYYINVTGQNLRLPFETENLPPLPAPPVQPQINFVNGNALPYPIRMKTYQNGQVFYYGYSNGAYRELPYSVQVSHNGEVTAMILTGTPPNLSLSGSGITYPILYALNNGQIEYYIQINGQDMELNFGGGPVEPPSSTENSEEPQIPQSSATANIKFVNPSSLQYPVKSKTYPNGQTFYFGYSQGHYHELPYSVQMTSSNGVATMTIGGTAPNIELVDPNGNTCPILYTVQNGEIEYYANMQGELIQLNFGSGPLMPDSGEQSQTSGSNALPSPPPPSTSQNQNQVQVTPQQNLNFITPNAAECPIKMNSYPDGETIYGALSPNGKYIEMPSTLQLSNNGQAMNLALSGTPPNIVLTTSGASYPLLYTQQNGQWGYYIEIDQQYIQIPFGSQGPPMPSALNSAQQQQPQQNSASNQSNQSNQSQ